MRDICAKGEGMGEPLLTVAEAAAQLRVSRRTLLRWLQTRRLPGVKIGRDWRIDPADLNRIIQASKTTPDRGRD